MNFRFLPFVILSFLFSNNVFAADGLEGTPLNNVGDINKSIQIEMKTTLTGDFTFYFMPLFQDKVQVNWNNEMAMEYSPTAGSNKIVYPLVGEGEKTVTIYADETVFMTFFIQSMNVTAVNFHPATNLKEVTLIENTIEEIDFSNLSALESVNITGDQVAGSLLRSIVVSNNDLLKVLAIPYNTSLGSLDLSKNENLVKFVGDNSQLSDADMFVNNVLLRELDINNCKFTSLNLSNQSNLKSLFCYSNQLTGALDLTNSPLLTDLNCNYNQLSDININSGIETLASLRCNGNKLSFSTFPRVQVSDAFDFYDQEAVDAELDYDGYSIDLTNILPVITESNIPIMDSDRTYSVAWKAFRTNGNEMTLNTNFYTKDGDRYTFKENFVTSTVFDHYVYAQITNTAYPAQINTIKVEVTGKTSVGVDDEESNKFVVYPNPFVDEVRISGVAQGSFVEVIDIQGRVVYSSVLQSDSDALFLDNLSSGIYLIQVNDSGKVYSTKVFKK